MNLLLYVGYCSLFITCMCVTATEALPNVDVNISATLGETIIFTCNVEDFDEIGEYRWFRLQSNKTTWRRIARHSKLNTLKLNSAAKGFEDFYKCNVSQQLNSYVYEFKNATKIFKLKVFTVLNVDDKEIHELTSFIYNDVSLNCTIEGINTTAEYMWFRTHDKGKTWQAILPTSSQDKILRQNFVTDSHDGIYRCNVSHYPDSTIDKSVFATKYFNLIIKGVADKNPDSINEIEATIGEKIVLECKIAGGNTLDVYEWYKSKSMRVWHPLEAANKQSSLTLSSVKQNDTGFYKCNVVTDKNVTDIFKLDVYMDCLKNISITLKVSFYYKKIFDKITKVNTARFYEWRCRGQTVAQSYEVSEDYNECNSKYPMTNTCWMERFGDIFMFRYIPFAQKNGAIFGGKKVFYYYDPDIETEYNTTYYTFLYAPIGEGDEFSLYSNEQNSAVLKCSLATYPNPLSVKWLKYIDNVPVNLSTVQFKYEKEIFPKDTMFFPKIEESSPGVYYCVIKSYWNETYVVKREFRMVKSFNLTKVPHIPVTVNNGATVTLHCHSEDPQIYTKELNIQLKFRKYNEHEKVFYIGKSSLGHFTCHIMNVTHDKIGLYSCYMNKILSTGVSRSSSVKDIVYYFLTCPETDAYIKPPLKTIYAVAGQPAVVVCKFEPGCDMLKHIIWTYIGSNLQLKKTWYAKPYWLKKTRFYGDTLLAPFTADSDEEVYKCTVKYARMSANRTTLTREMSYHVKMCQADQLKISKVETARTVVVGTYIVCKVETCLDPTKFIWTRHSIDMKKINWTTSAENVKDHHVYPGDTLRIIDVNIEAKEIYKCEVWFEIGNTVVATDSVEFCVSHNNDEFIFLLISLIVISVLTAVGLTIYILLLLHRQFVITNGVHFKPVILPIISLHSLMEKIHDRGFYGDMLMCNDIEITSDEMLASCKGQLLTIKIGEEMEMITGNMT